MRFYNRQHRFYCGVDLHTRAMYCCLVDQAGTIQEHRNLPTRPDRFLQLIEPYRGDLVVGAECMFSWYWLADLCADEGIDFVLGHALYMKAIHGGKTKNDKLDSEKIAMLLRGGMFPQAYVYPREMRSTRDLLRRRMRFMRIRAEALGHIQNTASQYNRPALGKLSRKSHRAGVLEQFDEESVCFNVRADLQLIEHLDEQIRTLELYLTRHAKLHDPHAYYLLSSTPGIGQVLALVILYEIHDVRRFPTVGQFLSYARLVKCPHRSAGKTSGTGGNKIGNAYLKWAFSEATCLLMRDCEEAARFVARKEKQMNKGKAMSILAARLARAVYFMLKRKEAFNRRKFFHH